MKTPEVSRRDRRAGVPLARIAVMTGAMWLGGEARADVLNENFNAGIPAAWTIEDYQPGGSALTWGLTSPMTYDNYTGADGTAAMADSDSPGDGIEYDIALLTPHLLLPSESGLTLSYLSNYQNLAGSDFADLDIRLVGSESGTWINLLRWNEDHGDSFGNPIGEPVVVALDDFAGQEVQFRFHYYDPNENDWNWYWQVDNVVVTPAPAAGAVGVLGLGAMMRRRRG
ncbi:MAG: choice-of-anchor J domain-containing protein [Phycisphaerales bacterium]